MARKMMLTHVVFFGFAIVVLSQFLESAGKDRFNMYKGENADVSSVLEDEKEMKQTYFYRTPPLGYNMGLKISSPQTDFGKRTINRFKNYMLGKESLDGEMLKRGPESLMFWTLRNGEGFDVNGDNGYEKY